jgi:hypothetical protein
MEKGNEVRLKKIPLKVFIDALIDVYTAGAEYVDLIGKVDEEQDSIGIAVTLDYMMMKDDGDNYFDNLAEKMLEKIKGAKLSDEDLNDLT